MDALLAKSGDYISMLSLPGNPQIAVALVIVALVLAFVSRDLVTVLTTIFLTVITLLASAGDVSEIGVSVAAFTVLHAASGLDKRRSKLRLAKLSEDFDALLFTVSTFLRGLDDRSREYDVWKRSDTASDETAPKKVSMSLKEGEL